MFNSHVTTEVIFGTKSILTIYIDPQIVSQWQKKTRIPEWSELTFDKYKHLLTNDLQK